MHQNYHFLKAIAIELNSSLTGLELLTAFSQNKDELLIGFANATTEQWIRLTLIPTFTTISFPNEFHRAKRNSVDLFPNLVSKKVIGCTVLENERCLCIQLEGEFHLLFKLFGGEANVIIYEKNQVIALFRKHITKDLEKNLNDWNRTIDQSLTGYEINGQGNTFPTLGKAFKLHLENHDSFSTLSHKAQYDLLEREIPLLEKAPFYLLQRDDKCELLLFKPIEIDQQTTIFQDAITIANTYYKEYSHHHFLGNEKKKAVKLLEKRIKQSENFIAKNGKKLNELKEVASYERTATLIMANLHQIKPHSTSVELIDFYTNEPVLIKLKRDLSPQKFAENLYRKAKNQKKEVKKLEENISNKEDQLFKLLELLEQVNELEEIKPLRKLLKEHKIITETAQENTFPFKRFEWEGFDIWVGKNAANNDLLTQKHAYKEDLWLHARDVAGSHVIIKYQAGKKVPETVIEKAASLAAWYSQRKTDSLCPVTVTPKKFVRKPKGLAPGMVIVDKEKVILVEPSAFS